VIDWHWAAIGAICFGELMFFCGLFLGANETLKRIAAASKEMETRP